MMQHRKPTYMAPVELEEARRALKLTQAELGALLGLSHKRISEYELGKFPIPKPVAYFVLLVQRVGLGKIYAIQPKPKPFKETGK